MTEKEAQGNPGQPGGWGVGEAVDPDTYPNGELLALEEQKRKDTAAWEDSNNRSPMDLENPAQPEGFAVPPATNAPIRAASTEVDVVAKVFVSKVAGREEGGKVLLGTSQDDYSLGEVIAVTDEKFWVAWRDGEDSIEKKADYQLIVRDDEDAE